MKRARGFSLLEVLLATTLLAAGMALAFATLRDATQSTERAEALAQRGEKLRAVQAFLRRQIEGAMPVPFEFVDATGEATLFEAERDQLRLVAPMPGYLSRGGPYLQTFRFVRGVGGLRLEFEHQLMTPDGPLDDEHEPQVLLDGIAEAQFEVRTVAPDGEPGPWTSDWDTPGQLPRLVRLRLRFNDADSRWPTLVAAPRVGAVPIAPPVPLQSAPGDLDPGDRE